MVSLENGTIRQRVAPLHRMKRIRIPELKRIKAMKTLMITLCILAAGLITLGYTWNTSSRTQKRQYKGMELEINDLADHGVFIHDPASAGFNSRFTSLVSIPNELTSSALSNSVVLENKTPQNINALCVLWRFYPSEGNPIERTAAFSFLDNAVFNSTNESLIKAGEQYPLSLLSKGLGIGRERMREIKDDAESKQNLDAESKQNLDTVNQLIARSVRWSFYVDAVLFSNGVMIGPDSTHYLDALTARINGGRDLFREVAEKLDRGENAWAHAASYAAETEEQIDARFPDVRARMRNPDYAYAVAKRAAARTVDGRKKNWGEKETVEFVRGSLVRQIPLVRK